MAKLYLKIFFIGGLIFLFSLVFKVLSLFIEIYSTQIAISTLIATTILTLYSFETFPDDADNQYLSIFIFRNTIMILISAFIGIYSMYFSILEGITEIIRAIFILCLILSSLSALLLSFDVINALAKMKENEIEEAKRRAYKVIMGGKVTETKKPMLDYGLVSEIMKIYREIEMELQEIKAIAYKQTISG